MVLLLGAALTYLNWRMTFAPALGWFSAVLTAAGMHLVTFDLLTLNQSPRSADLDPSVNPDLVVLLAVPVLALMGLRMTPLPRYLGPLGLGVTIALASAGLRIFQLDHSDDVRRADGDQPWAMVAAMVVLGLLACFLLANTWSLPHWARRATTLAGVVVVASHAALPLTTSGPQRAALAALSTAGAVGITMCAAAMCVESLVAVQTATRFLTDRVAEAERRAGRSSEVLHELRATVAGVNKASSLLRRGDALLPRSHRERLESMLGHELARMERLLEHRATTDRELVELDDVIEPLVIAQRALGHEVRWEPTGYLAVGAPDSIAEAVHILLSNAARHAGSAPVEVTVTPDGRGGLSVRVSDEGPGVDPEVAPYLFERGVHSATSPGQGIGLHVARRLVRDQGGDLSLERNQRGRGSTFLLVIPEPGEETAS